MPRRIDEERLFDAVVALWTRGGYAGTTTRAVAEHAGVDEATLFRRYGGRAELVVAALGHQLATGPLDNVVATDDLRSDLLAVVQAYEETFQQVEAVFPLLRSEAGRHAELRPALEVANANLQSVVRVLEHHRVAGRLRAEDGLSMARSLLGPLFFRGVTVAVRPDIPPLNPGEYVDGYLRGWAADPSS